MTPEEEGRWSGQPSSLAGNVVVVVAPRQARYCACGRKLSLIADLCRTCFLEQARKKREDAAGEAARTLNRLRLPKVDKPKPSAASLEDMVDIAWQEKPHLTRLQVERLVKKHIGPSWPLLP